jgi:hypothetical protein
MPILMLALLALGVFLVMGLMLFYAAYKESRTPHPNPESQAKPVAR